MVSTTTSTRSRSHVVLKRVLEAVKRCQWSSSVTENYKPINSLLLLLSGKVQDSCHGWVGSINVGEAQLSYQAPSTQIRAFRLP